jgi:hypothetical protein
MPVAQVIRFDERQAVGRPRRKPDNQPMGVVLLFPARHTLPAVAGFEHDDDRVAGRGRDPG